MIRYSFFTILFITLFFTAAQAQRFEPGYIVSNGGDTTRGFVSEKSLIRGYSKVVFKATKDGTSTSYLPTDIAGFGGGIDVFTSVRDPQQGRRIFVRELVSGPVRLFKHDHRTFSVFSDTAATAQLLRNKNFLRFYSRNCPDFSDRILRVKNSEESHVAFFEDLYKCLGISTRVNLRPIKPKYSFVSAEAGYGFMTFGYNRSLSGRFFGYINFEPSSAPVVGASLHYFPATRYLQNFSFQFNLQATKLLAQGTNSEATSASNGDIEHIVFDSYNFGFSLLGVKHYRLTPKNSILIGGGAAVQYLALVKGTWEQNSFFGSSVTTRQQNIEYRSNFPVGPSLLVGVSRSVSGRPVSINARYTLYNGDHYKIGLFALSGSFSITKVGKL